jgi:hypothetical protein
MLRTQPIRESERKDYEKFKKKFNFNMSTYSVEIGQVLDAEPEVSRFYTELVPGTMTPEEFWGR